jgi:alpha-tubulin suppressor-like RCC1 family protein
MHFKVKTLFFLVIVVLNLGIVDFASSANSRIAGGDSHTLALKSDGTVWAWGENWYGQLGDGTTALRYNPVQVVGLGGACPPSLF